MGQQLNVQPSDLHEHHQQYTLPLYTAGVYEGYHLKVVMNDGQMIRQPFGVDSFFNSYVEFMESGVLPHLIQLVHIVYGIEPMGGDKSVWCPLEKNPDAKEGAAHPTYWLAMNTPDEKFVRPWFIRLVWETATVARSV